MESVFGPRRNKEDRASLDWRVFTVHMYHPFAATDEVDLVLGVRLLWVGLPGRKHIEAEAERRHAQELQVKSARLLMLVEQL